ncbi:MAG: putative toxin-antitoxin system toxin component, PIN family [Actinobacteria bacterium]|nr:putative toxin-antitoxin system toxin component, PIN family [Actinomycetota bacterium]MCL6104568.1 putative toxin-antitoxin system toxin component, PIN family [Actinomycetota bacterium]
MRAVVDVNVIISALLNRNGTPAKVIQAWLQGIFEIVVSLKLLEELERALKYKKLQKYIKMSEIAELIEFFRLEGSLVEDPQESLPISSKDPDDDYIISLALSTQSVIVSGDSHLLALSDEIPVYSPIDFLERLLTSFS